MSKKEPNPLHGVESWERGWGRVPRIVVMNPLHGVERVSERPERSVYSHPGIHYMELKGTGGNRDLSIRYPGESITWS